MWKPWKTTQSRGRTHKKDPGVEMDSGAQVDTTVGQSRDPGGGTGRIGLRKSDAGGEREREQGEMKPLGTSELEELEDSEKLPRKRAIGQ